MTLNSCVVGRQPLAAAPLPWSKPFAPRASPAAIYPKPPKSRCRVLWQQQQCPHALEQAIRPPCLTACTHAHVALPWHPAMAARPPFPLAHPVLDEALCAHKLVLEVYPAVLERERAHLRQAGRPRHVPRAACAVAGFQPPVLVRMPGACTAPSILGPLQMAVGRGAMWPSAMHPKPGPHFCRPVLPPAMRDYHPGCGRRQPLPARSCPHRRRCNAAACHDVRYPHGPGPGAWAPASPAPHPGSLAAAPDPPCHLRRRAVAGPCRRSQRGQARCAGACHAAHAGSCPPPAAAAATQHSQAQHGTVKPPASHGIVASITTRPQTTSPLSKPV